MVDSTGGQATTSEATNPNGKPIVFFILGGPGAGKGTQCAKLVANHGFIHLSAGDLLRAEVASGSEHGEMIDKIIKAGTIVPVQITCGLIKAAMEKTGWASKTYLVDGFPRNEDNFNGWNEVMGDSIELAGVFHFVADEDQMTSRILARQEGRTDDNIETLRRRFVQYKTEQIAIINRYEEMGLVKTINGMQAVDAVYNDVKTALTGYI